MKLVKDYICFQKEVNVAKSTEVVLPLKKRKRVVSALSLDVIAQDVTVFPPSIVDSSQYESLSEIVAKHLRGEPTLSSSRVDAVVMESESRDPEDILADMHVMRQSGADIIDASEALRKGQEAKTQLDNMLKAKNAKDKADKDTKDAADKAELERLRSAEAARTKAP